MYIKMDLKPFICSIVQNPFRVVYYNWPIYHKARLGRKEKYAVQKNNEHVAHFGVGSSMAGTSRKG